jgi:hypothetical protein
MVFVNDSRFQIRQDKYILLVMQKLNSDLSPTTPLYVWLDAPIGYMASFKKLCNEQAIDFDEYFNKDSKTELYHFIGGFRLSR